MFSIFKVPRDIALLIFQYIPPETYPLIARVNKEASSITNDKQLWIFFLKELGIPLILLNDLSINNIEVKNLKRVYFQLQNRWSLLKEANLTMLHIIFATRNIPFIDNYLNVNKIIFDQELIRIAAMTANLAIVKWLREAKQISYSPDILGGVASISETPVFSYLLDYFLPKTFIQFKFLLCCACRSGNLNNVIYLIEKRNIELNAGACNEAIKGGHLNLVKHFVERYKYELVGQNLSAAYMYKKPDIIAYINSRRENKESIANGCSL